MYEYKIKIWEFLFLLELSGKKIYHDISNDSRRKKAFMVCGTKTLFIPCASFILFVESDSSSIKWTFMYKKIESWRIQLKLKSSI